MPTRRAFAKRPRLALFTCVTLGALASACSSPSTKSATPHASPTSATATALALTALPRNVHPLASPEFDRGRRNPSSPRPARSTSSRRPQQQAARDALLAAVQNPTSPSYHKWLGAEDYAARFGARPPTSRASTRVARSPRGSLVDRPSRIGDARRVPRHGRAGRERVPHRAPRLLIRRRIALRDGDARRPSRPSSRRVVLGLHGFHDFHPQAPQHTAKQPQYQDPTYGAHAWRPPTSRRSTTRTRSSPRGPTARASTSSSSGRRTTRRRTSRASEASFEPGYTVTDTNVLVPGTGTQQSTLHPTRTRPSSTSSGRAPSRPARTSSSSTPAAIQPTSTSTTPSPTRREG